ncbi:hypothetical protein [Mycolicibacterium neoaurum]|uniref:hypothetical protein n=1 Tax=Mycolicibacterium neoaurum TaxID=1795 RepID=UPI001F4C799D|nr:hypothetical protein [Mycolicibacterium neoaurum]
MAKRQVTVSDLTGVELQDNEVVTVTVKEASRKFEASAEELKVLKPVTNVVELEYVYPNGERETVLVSKTEFNKVIPQEKLNSFPSNRGRQPGYSPKLVKSSSNGASVD